MESRRSFLKKTGKGALFSTVVLSSADAYSFGRPAPDRDRAAGMRIGIIGAENSHTIGYGSLFNIDKKYIKCYSNNDIQCVFFMRTFLKAILPHL